MKTLKEIKDEVSKELGYKSYIHCYQETDRQEYEDLMEEVCRRAQLECGKATLEKISEKIKSSITNYRNEIVRIPGLTTQIDKTLITSEENIVIIK